MEDTELEEMWEDSCDVDPSVESRSDKILSLFCCNLWKLGTELWSLSGRLIGDAFVLSCFWGLEYSRNRPSNFIITKKDKVVIHRLPASRLQLAVTQLNHLVSNSLITSIISLFSATVRKLPNFLSHDPITANLSHLVSFAKY